MEREQKKKKRKASKQGRKELGGLHQDSTQCVQLKKSLGRVPEGERGLDRQARRYPCQPHAMVICSGRDGSPVKELEMCLLGLLLELNGLEPQPQVFQKSLCPDGGAQRKKDTRKINAVIYLGEGQQSWTVYLETRRQGGDENWDT